MSALKTYDRAATVLSLSCVAHCVALPIFAVASPFVAAAAEAEWIHWLMAVFAISSSGIVIATAHNSRSPVFLVPAALGILFVSFALFAENFGVDETPPTIVGGILLAGAHIYRLIKHK